MFSKTLKTVMIVAILATSAATTASAGNYQGNNYRGHNGGNVAIGAAGFLLGTFIGARLHRRDGSTVTSRYPHAGPRDHHVYEEHDARGKLIKRKIIKKKVKKVRKQRKKRPVFASSYDPQTNVRRTVYRDGNGKRVTIVTRGRALPPQVR